jgi:hypothetical protein
MFSSSISLSSAARTSVVKFGHTKWSVDASPDISNRDVALCSDEMVADSSLNESPDCDCAKTRLFGVSARET